MQLESADGFANVSRHVDKSGHAHLQVCLGRKIPKHCILPNLHSSLQKVPEKFRTNISRPSNVVLFQLLHSLPLFMTVTSCGFLHSLPILMNFHTEKSEENASKKCLWKMRMQPHTRNTRHLNLWMNLQRNLLSAHHHLP